MDLSDPLRSLIPSLDSAVLEVLASVESPLSASAIWRASRRGTRAGQQPVLDRLTAHGLVTASPAAVGHLYSLNRDHLLAEPVLSAARARARLVEQLQRRVEALEPRPLHALVFGSFARGEADENSDLDILIIVSDGVDPRSEQWNTQIDILVDDIERWTGNPAQPLSYTEPALHRLVSSNEPIVAGWRQDGIRLIGTAPETLLRTGEVA